MTTLDQIHALEPRLRNAVRNDDLHAQFKIAHEWLTLIQQAQMDEREIETMRAMPVLRAIDTILLPAPRQ